MGKGGSIDSLMQAIQRIMKEMMQRNKFVMKKDIFAVVGQQYDQGTFEAAIDRLMQDGTIYTTYDQDVLTMDL